MLIPMSGKKTVSAQDVTVRYSDEDGNPIADTVTLSGKVGESYTSEQKSIEGFTFKEVKGATTGTFTEQEQEVTYIYTKNQIRASPVTVHYVDAKGTKLSEGVLLEGYVGETYISEQKEIDGYIFKEAKGATTGTFTEQEQEVTYMYEKNKINLIVPPLENNSKTKDNNTHEEHSISHSKSESDETQFPQTGERIVSSMWGYIGILLLACPMCIYIKKKKVLINLRYYSNLPYTF